MADNFSMSGDKEFLQNLKDLGQTKVLQVAAKSLYTSAEQVMTKSKADYVPVDTGTLRSTGHVELPVIEDNKVTIELGYGGPSAEYAAAVHETNRNYRHGKQWKYLETPLMGSIDEIKTNLIDDLKEAF